MRIAVVDDNDLWRESLVVALHSRGMTVVADEAEGDSLLRRLPELGPIDVAILDLRLPPTWSDEGIAVGRTLRARVDGIGVIVLSGYEQDVQLHYATQALDDFSASSGGVGYLFKDRTNRGALQEAVLRVAAGRVVVDPIFAHTAADELRRRASGTEGLTKRDVEILDLLVQGLSNKEIGERLFVSIAVVERHLTRIFKELSPAETPEGKPVKRIVGF